MITWVIGQGGLLGGALARQLPLRFEPGPVPWADPESAAATLHRQARSFEAHADGQPWRVIWAAGAATTATSKPEALAELVPLEGLLSGLRSALPTGPGSFFMTSSAGGVYAGSTGPPFTSTTPVAPLSPYGELKLAQETRVIETFAGVTPVIIGRISNLYGPGQNLGKLQGLVSSLARAAITRQPVNIFVSLDTTRDYIAASDAAAAILLATEQPRPPSARTEIIATGRGTTIGQLIRTMNEIAKRRVPVALGSHPSAASQAHDLRLVPSLLLPQITPLPTGMKAVHDDLLSRVQAQPLAR